MLVSLTTLGHGYRKQTAREWGNQATPSFALLSRILNIMTKEIIECTFYKIKNIIMIEVSCSILRAGCPLITNLN